MSQRNEHLIVIMLESVGFNVEFEVWPPHITIVPWFPVNHEQRLDELLKKIANRHTDFEVTVGDVEDWGREDKFKVSTITDYTEQLHQLHRDVFNSLEKGGFVIHQKDFLGDKYRPHITLRSHNQKDQSFWKGQVLQIKEFSLVSQVRLKKSGRMIKKLKKNYELQG